VVAQEHLVYWVMMVLIQIDGYLVLLRLRLLLVVIILIQRTQLVYHIQHIHLR
jgi:hypothetical protein